MSAKGEQPVRPITTGNEHNHLTVMLCCTADGHKRPPFIVFKCKTMPKEKFLPPPPPKVILCVIEEGFLTEETVLEWLRLVWLRRPGGHLRPKSMLVLGLFRGHIMECLKRTVVNADRQLVINPAGLTPVLLPLDEVLNKPFKERVAALYKDWMDQPGRQFPDADGAYEAGSSFEHCGTVGVRRLLRAARQHGARSFREVCDHNCYMKA